MWNSSILYARRGRFGGALYRAACLVGVFWVVFAGSVAAQELNARVEILSPQLPQTNKRALDVLQRVVSDFLNKRSWTGVSVQPEERIDCRFVITVQAWDGSSEFTAQAQVMSMRPVFNTSYSSPVLNLADKEFNFSFTEGQMLDYSDAQFSNNLTSLLAYYAYLIIGLDADTFERNGGEAFYKQAQQVVNNAQVSPVSGWRAMGDDATRYWLVNNLLDRRFQPIRDFLYDVSINGLDRLADQSTQARQYIFEQLKSLEGMERFGQSSVLDQVFFAAKANELVGVLSGLGPQERAQAYQLLAGIDPANANKYEVLRGR